ncbi:MAG: hypothetical protein GY774_35790 [Planctomycetes bacterium]|nr:hypothetical protein [Planctomycetota bacterium]
MANQVFNNTSRKPAQGTGFMGGITSGNPGGIQSTVQANQAVNDPGLLAHLLNQSNIRQESISDFLGGSEESLNNFLAALDVARQGFGQQEKVLADSRRALTGSIGLNKVAPTGVFNRELGLINSVLGLSQAEKAARDQLLTSELGLGLKHTGQEPYIDFMNFLAPLFQQQEQLRFAMPQTAGTQSAQFQPGFFTNLSRGLQLADPISDILGNVFNSNNSGGAAGGG